MTHLTVSRSDFQNRSQERKKSRNLKTRNHILGQLGPLGEIAIAVAVKLFRNTGKSSNKLINSRLYEYCNKWRFISEGKQVLITNTICHSLLTYNLPSVCFFFRSCLYTCLINGTHGELRAGGEEKVERLMKL